MGKQLNPNYGMWLRSSDTGWWSHSTEIYVMHIDFNTYWYHTTKWIYNNICLRWIGILFVTGRSLVIVLSDEVTIFGGPPHQWSKFVIHDKPYVILFLTYSYFVEHAGNDKYSRFATVAFGKSVKCGLVMSCKHVRWGHSDRLSPKCF